MGWGREGGRRGREKVYTEEWREGGKNGEWERICNSSLAHKKQVINISFEQNLYNPKSMYHALYSTPRTHTHTLLSTQTCVVLIQVKVMVQR